MKEITTVNGLGRIDVLIDKGLKGDNLMYRKAVKNDLPYLKRLAHEVIRTNYTSFLGEELVSQFIGSGAADAEIDNGFEDCIVLDDDGINGFAITEGNKLHLLMINPQRQRKGRGTSFLKYLEEMLFGKYATIKLQTFENNITATNFYIKNAWRQTGKEDADGLTMLLFEKTDGQKQ